MDEKEGLPELGSRSHADPEKARQVSISPAPTSLTDLRAHFRNSPAPGRTTARLRGPIAPQGCYSSYPSLLNTTFPRIRR